MESWLATSTKRELKMIALADRRIGYAEPILLKLLCLTCHGSNRVPAMTARINELYPQDRATGFGTGDLKGVFWIEISAGQ